MIIKAADDKSATIAELEQYLGDARIPDDVKRKIEKERNNVSAGAANERDSAFLIDFRFGPTKNWMVLHDLRIEEAGRTAQIDHLLINRLLEFYVLESKSFGNGIAINELGEFNTWVGNRPVGIASPIEQNRRHVAVLDDLLRALPMPTRLGMRITPTLKSFVLVSDKANIKRPAKAKFNTAQVIKAEVLGALIDSELDKMGAGTMLSSVTKMVSAETIETVARLLESEHRPITFDYAGKFDLVAFTTANATDNLIESTASQEAPQCPKCGKAMVKRKALKGANAGNSFWGCSTYPKCRGVLAIE
jgi:ribosomal protein L37AE/L43A